MNDLDMKAMKDALEAVLNSKLEKVMLGLHTRIYTSTHLIDIDPIDYERMDQNVLPHFYGEVINGVRFATSTGPFSITVGPHADSMADSTGLVFPCVKGKVMSVRVTPLTAVSADQARQAAVDDIETVPKHKSRHTPLTQFQADVKEARDIAAAAVMRFRVGHDSPLAILEAFEGRIKKAVIDSFERYNDGIYHSDCKCEECVYIRGVLT